MPLSADRPRRSHQRSLAPSSAPPAPALFVTHSFALPCKADTLLGDLVLPQQATGLVLFAHAAGSCRRSSRSQHITRLLRQANLGTFSIDLLTPSEAQQRHRLPASEQLLQRRLGQVVKWLRQPGLLGLCVGLLGEGSAAAVLLATGPQLGGVVGATVALGNTALEQPSVAAAPTLLLAGEADEAGCQNHQRLQPLLGASCAAHVLPQ